MHDIMGSLATYSIILQRVPSKKEYGKDKNIK
jgi:hypothetical protein